MKKKLKKIRLEAHCLHAVTTHYGFPISKKEIDDYFCSLDRKQMVIELRSVAKKIGLKTEVVIAANWRELRMIPTPAILFDIKSEEDIVILDRVSRWFAVIRNPKTNEHTKIFRFNFESKNLAGLLLLLPDDGL